MSKFLLRALLVLAVLVVLAPRARAEEKDREPAPALRVGKTTISVTDAKRRLLAVYGREHVTYFIRNVQLRRAIERLGLTVDADALEESRVETLARIDRAGRTVERFLRDKMLPDNALERLVYNGAAGPLVVKAEGTSIDKLTHYLGATQIVKPIFDPDDPVYATVDGAPILVDDLFAGFDARLRPRHIEPFVKATIRSAGVDRELRLRDVVVLSSEVERELARQEAEFHQRYGRALSFESFLLARGTTPELHKEALRRVLAVRSLLGAGVTDEMLEAHLKENIDHFGKAEVRARHILLAVDPDAPESDWEAARGRAADLLATIRAGAKFEEVAKTSSDDPTTRDTGGDIGYFPRRDRMVEEVAAAAFALTVGETSEPVRTAAGWHLVQLVDRKNPSRIRLHQVRDEVRIDYLNQKSETWAAEIGEKADAEVLWDFLKGR